MFLFSSRRRHTRCALVTGVQTCALPISVLKRIPGGPMSRVLIGKADDVAAGEARKLARIRIGEMQQGVDPNVAKRQRKADAERSGMTLAQGLAIYPAERDKLRPATKDTNDLETTQCWYHWCLSVETPVVPVNTK